MGKAYGIKCSKCNYGLSVTEGFGMMDSPHAVFYGRCDDPTQNRSIAFPDGYCEEGEPRLLTLVKSKRIRDRAFELISNGAVPEAYGHALYGCPKCNRLANRFHFVLRAEKEQYEPDYHCSKCRTVLRRVSLKQKKGNKCEVVYENNESTNWKCPECGGSKLEYSDDLIYWD